MKRMNVREFRAHMSELRDEPIEVTRYGESVGYWVPHGLTTMPKRPPVTYIKPRSSAASRKVKPEPYLAEAARERSVPDAVLDVFIRRMNRLNDEMDKLGVKVDKK